MTKNNQFVSLGTKSDFSLMSSFSTVPQIIAKAKEDNQESCALVDESNLFASLSFYLSCKKAGIKPIIGSVFNLCDDIKNEDTSIFSQSKITVIAENEKGWSNLKKLSSDSFSKGFKLVPRIDFSMIKECSEGLVFISPGVVTGHDFSFHRAFLGRSGSSMSHLLKMKEAATEDRFFVGIEKTGSAKEDKESDAVYERCIELGFNPIAVSVSMFTEKGESDYYRALTTIQSKSFVEGVSLFANEEEGEKANDCTDFLHIKNGEENIRLFSGNPKALENLKKITSRCSFEIEVGKTFIPKFKKSKKEENNTIREKASHSLRSLWSRIKMENPNAVEAEYLERIETELETIFDMGFSGYFLIVENFVQAAKSKGIFVGPGRGSGAGSLVAYLLGITKIDPIPYGLLWERFLNPERVSLPDFDIDFCRDRRGEVIHYLKEKFGSDSVSQIINYSTYRAKVAIKDAARIYGIPFQEINKITKGISEDGSMTLREMRDDPSCADFDEKIKSEEIFEKVYDLAVKLEGKVRQVGVHAAGVVISDRPLYEVVPLCSVAGSSEKVAQWDKKYSEIAGLVKFDLLGLKALSILSKADVIFRRMKIDGKVSIREDFIDVVPLNRLNMSSYPRGANFDRIQKTFELLRSGQTSGIFQLESDGMKDLLVRVKPDCFEDLAAIVALFRPGPIQSGMVDSYIDSKLSGDYVRDPDDGDILDETYGVIVYQEQVMRLAQRLAGYTLGQADILRRAMGKKDALEMSQQENSFLSGCEKNGVGKDKAQRTFNLIAKFAAYGFNKSHSVAYGYVSFLFAHLKANYPQVFYAASLSAEVDNSEKMAQLIDDAQNFAGKSIRVLNPDINLSDSYFSVLGENDIIFGLCGIKGVSPSLARDIVIARIDSRNQDAPFLSVYDFVSRMPSVGSSVLLSLVKVGCFDRVEGVRTAKDRIELIKNSDLLAKKLKTTWGKKHLAIRESNLSLFSEEEFASCDRGGNEPDVADLSNSSSIYNTASLANISYIKEALFGELDVLGFSLYHNLANTVGKIYNPNIEQDTNKTLELMEKAQSGSFSLTGQLVICKKRRTKSGDRMATAKLITSKKSLDVLVFSSSYDAVMENLDTGKDGDNGLLDVTVSVLPAKKGFPRSLHIGSSSKIDKSRPEEKELVYDFMKRRYCHG